MRKYLLVTNGFYSADLPGSGGTDRFFEFSPRIGPELRSTPAQSGFDATNTNDQRYFPKWILEPRALRLLESLPAEIRLNALRRSFPHILNLIAMNWRCPVQMQRTVQSLLIDARGNREGFPIGVQQEITDLADYYFTVIRPQLST